MFLRCGKLRIRELLLKGWPSSLRLRLWAQERVEVARQQVVEETCLAP